MGDTDRILARYREVKRYLDWDERHDYERLVGLFPVITPHFPGLIEDFYEEIQRHPGASAVITGGEEQVSRLKATLHQWLIGLFQTPPDEDYAQRCWRIGRRHAEIGLDPLYVIAAMARLRSAMCRVLRSSWTGEFEQLAESLRSLYRRLDLDLALIQDAYQAESEDRLQRAERMATLGQVAGGLAHELRNPLNVVKTSVYYLKNARSASAEKVAEHLQRIGRGVDRADAVITALSSFARLPTPEARPTPLLEMVRDSLETNPPDPAIEVQLEIEPSLTVAVDPAQLQIVLGNLLRNANEAMDQAGTLTVRARTLENGRIELDVEDTGIGMAPELRDRVTEPLFSTKARGLGLGLAISREILTKNGGTLRISSEPGVGSIFTLVLNPSSETGDRDR
ncbi:protoglobin domain-containing protein [Tautonia marina]|uniref:protoglobin domain-containing protein n=1 Tax=Tautonia marina TaxID=2653855 RepID=UPI001260EC95|nr:protoglobin domain-containing protein [Tautonia marina]